MKPSKPKNMHANERIELPHGLYAIVEIDNDCDYGLPWEENDGHGIVSEWTHRDKLSGERVLCGDRRSRRYYDVKASMRKAAREGWGVEPELAKGKTRGQVLAMAVDRDYEYLCRWCGGEWFWGTLKVTLFDENGEAVGSDYMGGVEMDYDHPEYWQDVAFHDMIMPLYEEEIKVRADTLRAERWEAKERAYWNTRDVVTL
jgi:hypothetical protein